MPSPVLHEENSDSSSDGSYKDDDIITLPPKVPSDKYPLAQRKRTTKPSRVASTSVLTSAPLKTTPMPDSAVPTSRSASNIKRASVEKKEQHELFTDSESSSSDEDPLSAGIPKPIVMDTRTGPTHKSNAKLEDLFEEPSMEGLLLENNETGSSSDESIGVTLSSTLSVIIGEAVISGTALEQLNEVGGAKSVNNVYKLDCICTCLSKDIHNISTASTG